MKLSKIERHEKRKTHIVRCDLKRERGLMARSSITLSQAVLQDEFQYFYPEVIAMNS